MTDITPLRRDPWYRIEAAADRAELFIYDYIGRDVFGSGIGADAMIRDMSKIRAKQLDVRINSGGGDVFDGLAIYQALGRFPGRVVTHIDGLAASIASVIALAGSEVRIAKTGYLMIHNAHAVSKGGASDMRALADRLENVSNTIAGVYVARSGQPVEQVKAWMDEETWFNAADAKAAGMVDTVTDEVAMAAHFDLSVFGKVPAELVVGVAPPAPADPFGPLGEDASRAWARHRDRMEQLNSKGA